MKKLIKYLYHRFCEPDVVSMTRKQLGLFANPINVSNLAANEQDVFCQRCKDLLMNDTFNQVCDEVVDGIKDQMFHNTESKYLIYDRFSINGVALIKERLEAYVSQIEKKEQEFDKYAVV